MDDNIKSVKRCIPTDDFFYIIRIDMNINGFISDFEVLDTNLLESISYDDCIVKSISFCHVKNRISVLKCRIATKDLLKAYSFIDNKLKPMIIKSLVLIEGITDLSIEDNIKCVIEDEEEAIKKGFPIIPYDKKYLELVVKTPNIEENKFKSAMRNFIKNNSKFDNSLFWMYVSYSIIGTSEVKNNFDYISQYRLLWTAFNSFYSKLYIGESDRKSVEAFATKKYVIEYFTKLISSHDTYKLLKTLSCEKLILKGNNNVSEKLKQSMEMEVKNYNEISLNGVLCLYAVRNAIIHGYAEKEVELCRTAFEVLNPLIKLSIISEINSVRQQNQSL